MKSKYGFAGVNSNLNSGRDNQSAVQQQIKSLANNFLFARVVDIVLDDQHPKFDTLGQWSSMGTIFYEQVEASAKLNPDELNTASPLLPYIKSYPVVNEIVLLFLAPNNSVGLNSNTKKYFYLNPIALWNNQHLNAYPDIELGTTTQPSQNKSYQQIEEGQTRKSSNEEIDYDYNSPLIGGTFSERSNIHPLLAYAGDVILEGRWGNSIRFGSTTKSSSIIYDNDWSISGDNGNPITIIRNGQPTNSNPEGFLPIVENINRDLSSIYLTSNQQIPLITSITNNPSINSNEQPKSIGSYNGSQVILSSDRLLFNTKTDSILLNSQKTISLSSLGTIGLYSREGDVVIQSAKNNVRLGDVSANQSVMMGDTFMEDFADLLGKLENLTQQLSIEPNLGVSTGAAASAKTQITLMLTNIKSYVSKIVKTI